MSCKYLNKTFQGDLPYNSSEYIPEPILSARKHQGIDWATLIKAQETTMTPSEAKLKYIQMAQKLQLFGATLFDVHLKTNTIRFYYPLSLP